MLQFGERSNLNPFICVFFPHVICTDVYTLTTNPNEATTTVQADSRTAGVEFYTFHERRTFITLFGGLGVACWPLVPKFAGSNPAEAVGFLRGEKKSSARLPSEGK